MAQDSRPMLIRNYSCAPIVSAFEVQFGLDVRALEPDDPRLDRSPFMRRLLGSVIRISVLIVIVLIAIAFPSFVSYSISSKHMLVLPGGLSVRITIGFRAFVGLEPCSEQRQMSIMIDRLWLP
jgi:hypothetical protein